MNPANVFWPVLWALVVFAALPVKADVRVAQAATTVENISLTWVGGGIVIDSPNQGLTEISVGQTDFFEAILANESGTLIPMTAMGSVGVSAFSGAIGAKNLFVALDAEASAPGEFVTATGLLRTGSDYVNPTGWNVTLLAHTTAVLSFDVVSSASLVNAVAHEAYVVTALTASFGENGVTVLSCEGSFAGRGLDCARYAGYPDRAHVVWTVSSEDVWLGTNLSFQAVASVVATSAVPEPAGSYLILLGGAAFGVRILGLRKRAASRLHNLTAA